MYIYRFKCSFLSFPTTRFKFWKFVRKLKKKQFLSNKTSLEGSRNIKKGVFSLSHSVIGKWNENWNQRTDKIGRLGMMQGNWKISTFLKPLRYRFYSPVIQSMQSQWICNITEIFHGKTVTYSSFKVILKHDRNTPIM